MKLDAKFYGDIFKAKDGSLVSEDQYMVFLAKDNAVPAMLTAYRDACVSLKADAEQIDAIEAMMARVDAWRAANPDKLKTPDAAGEILLDPSQKPPPLLTPREEMLDLTREALDLARDRLGGEHGPILLRLVALEEYFLTGRIS